MKLSNIRFNGFYEIGEIDDEELVGAIMATRYQGKWVLCRHKERDTWEIPGGKREPGEDIVQTAQRELFEEAGIIKSEIKPICIYSVDVNGIIKFGLLCNVEALEFGDLPESEIKEIKLFDEMPTNLTYPYTRENIIPKILENDANY